MRVGFSTRTVRGRIIHRGDVFFEKYVNNGEDVTSNILKQEAHDILRSIEDMTDDKVSIQSKNDNDAEVEATDDDEAVNDDNVKSDADAPDDQISEGSLKEDPDEDGGPKVDEKNVQKKMMMKTQMRMMVITRTNNVEEHGDETLMAMTPQRKMKVKQKMKRNI